MTTEQFNALGRDQKVMIVAHDIKEQIRLEKIQIEAGNYMDMQFACDPDLDVKSNLEEIKECKVCALGGAMISITRFANTLTFDELNNFSENDKALELLSSVFSPHQMLMIETAFEGYQGDMDECYHGSFGDIFVYDSGMSYRLGDSKFHAQLNEEELLACIKFNEVYFEDDEYRLIAICDNILSNNGIFKP